MYEVCLVGARLPLIKFRFKYFKNARKNSEVEQECKIGCDGIEVQGL